MLRNNQLLRLKKIIASTNPWLSCYIALASGDLVIEFVLDILSSELLIVDFISTFQAEECAVIFCNNWS